MFLELRAALDCLIVVVSKNQISSDLVGEAVILDLSTSVYYGLNQVGCSVWNPIQQQKTLQEVRPGII